MVEANDYESELGACREEIAAVLSGVVDGILAGSIRLGDGEEEGDELSAPVGAADASSHWPDSKSSVTETGNGRGDSATAMGTSLPPVARGTHANTTPGKDSGE